MIVVGSKATQPFLRVTWFYSHTACARSDSEVSDRLRALRCALIKNLLSVIVFRQELLDALVSLAIVDIIPRYGPRHIASVSDARCL
jgi:hypothetical protein